MSIFSRSLQGQPRWAAADGHRCILGAGRDGRQRDAFGSAREPRQRARHAARSIRAVTPRTERSYRALLQVPGLGRILLSMQLSRIAQSMVGVALVLFTLKEYGSPALTGAVMFASVFPGLLVAPVAGVLLDRHGRTRLVILDYVVALVAMAAIGGLALAHALPVPVLFAITIVSSLTAILSQTGLRSLFPLLVPERLWERVNAIDSNGYLVATIIGPPLAAGLVSVVGGPATLILIGVLYGGAALAMIGAPDPDTRTATSGSLLRDAWDGIRYTWRNRTLRGLGFSISLLNLSGGMVTIVVPLIVVQQLRAPEAVVGLVFAASGVTGMISALIAGRLDSRGREWSLLVLPMGGIAVADLFLLGGTHAPDVAIALLLVGLGLALGGLLNGPMDIGLFTIRQRRTDPAWMGRAFAVSMAFNFAGYPIGAALAGSIAAVSIDAAIVVGAVASVLAGLIAAAMIPRRDELAPIGAR
jgi:MFS family permease